jgi:hypothetical protein
MSSSHGLSPAGVESSLPSVAVLTAVAGGGPANHASPFSQPRPPSSVAAMSETYHFDHMSPNTMSSESWTADIASTRWLDLLAADAALNGFSLEPSPAAHVDEGPIATASPAAARGVEQPDRMAPLGPGDRELLRPRPSVLPRAEQKSWQVDTDILLNDHDAMLFRNFAERSSLWLDLLDPHKHFSTYAIRLALRNPGLMRAILALSGRHLSLLQARNGGPSQDHLGHSDGSGANKSTPSEDILQNYYETLHYVQTALQYNTYTHSEQLLATALIISAYEMLDEADGRGNWQRHLKGVFWIQVSYSHLCQVSESQLRT